MMGHEGYTMGGTDDHVDVPLYLGLVARVLLLTDDLQPSIFSIVRMGENLTWTEINIGFSPRQYVIYCRRLQAFDIPYTPLLNGSWTVRIRF